MNDTILGLLSALAIYGLATLALPRSGWDTGDDDPAVQAEDSVDIEKVREPQGDEPENG